MSIDAGERQAIAKAVVRKWGVESQIGMAIEECAELIVALRHLARGRVSLDQVAEEVADVEILCAQLRVTFGIGEQVDAHADRKYERLQQRVKEYGDEW